MVTRVGVARAAAVSLMLVGSAVVSVVASPPAGAATVETVPVPGAGPTNGVAVTPDGAAWVVVEAGAASTLVRVSPTGQVTSTPALGGRAVSVAVVAGKLWVTQPEQHRIAVVDPAASGAALTFRDTGAGNCGPAAVVDGGDGNAYVSLPTDGTCTSKIAKLPVAGGAAVTLSGLGTAYDLAVSNGSLFVPDSDGDVVRRLTLGTLAPTATYTAPTGSTPDGIAVAGDTVATTLYGTGRLGTASATANGTSALTTVPLGVTGPYGVAAVGTEFWAAGVNGVVARRTDGTTATVPGPAGAEPWDVAAGLDGTVWVSDQANTRVLKLTSRAPRATTAAAAGVTAKSASVTGTVNPGGESTATRVEYGPTTAYGATAAGPTVAGIADQPVTVPLTGLKAGTAYHYHVVATNARGTTAGADQSFTTPLGAKVAVRASVAGKATRIGRITVSKLAGKEKVTVACKGAGCPEAARRQKTKAGKKTKRLTVGQALSGVALPAGTTVTVTVTRAGVPGVRTTVKTRAGKKPTVTTATLS